MVEAGGSGNDSASSYRLEPELRRLRPTKREFPVWLSCTSVWWHFVQFTGFLGRFAESEDSAKKRQNWGIHIFVIGQSCSRQRPQEVWWREFWHLFLVTTTNFLLWPNELRSTLAIMFTILAFFLLGIERFLYGKCHESKVRSSMYSRKKYQKMENLHFVFLAWPIKDMFITLVLTLRLRSKLAFLDPLCKKKSCIGKALWLLEYTSRFFNIR